MNREYHKWWSPRLGREMELLVFGHAGVPTIIFPTSQGRFFEFEDRGMVGALWHKIEGGGLQLYCVDSVDNESWYNRNVPPRWRIARHTQYEDYVLHEVVPLIKQKNSRRDMGAAGCSFGGYHAMNLALRRPDMVNACLSMGGAFDITQFLDGYYDEDCYFNCPPHYLKNMGDSWNLDRYRQNKFVLATGEHDMCWNENERLAEIMREKHIPHRLDVWRGQTGHDWPWWQRMAQVYFQ
jgi:esterase/lipase superfamily enzyme